MKNAVFLIPFVFFLACSQKSETKEQVEEILKEIVEPEKTEPEVSQEVAESFGLIGSWSIPSSFGGGELKIEHHLGTYYKNEEHSDGTVHIAPMDMVEEGGEKLFSLKDESSDDIWAVTKDGKLELRSRDGVKYSSEAL
ncbi:hypothetical protein [Cecembia lonarensis]|uniref:Lipocalin-like domain-containing protein n=1 Tax=Cecembia lonarensis (strain CCUG 58316 / KCTC 22772 / LW9) TaxID=1225176 RepID=K1L723_CECL9|nr:hypothetical protein [Cecembia lonarensis]EKB47892.1 hypothetical protein B879_03509 [Cecembia lonarensis LW9]